MKTHHNRLPKSVNAILIAVVVANFTATFILLKYFL